MAKITILRQSQQAQLSPAGQVTQLIRVDFKVGDDGPFSISIPVDQFSAEELHARLTEFANKIAALRTKVEGA